jgi:NADH-quinone oxidoreductase subunit L
MSGIPPFAAFFSKDFILEEEYLVGSHWLFYIAVAASILTAFYLTRAYTLTFLGSPHSDKSANVSEAPKVMLWPAAILALLSMLGGFLGFAIGERPILARLLAHLITPSEVEISTHFPASAEMALITCAALAALILAIVLYRRFSEDLGPTIEFFTRGFYIDQLYDRCIVAPIQGVAAFVAHILEPKLFNRSIDLVGSATTAVAGTLQAIQSGQIRSYVAWLALGALFLITYFAL